MKKQISSSSLREFDKRSLPRQLSPWRHKKTGGVYRIICVARGQCSSEKSDYSRHKGVEDEMFVVYASFKSGWWVRPLGEFLERFEEV